MRLNLKRPLALLLCVCLCVGIAACSRSEESDGEAVDSSEASVAPSNGERFASALQTLSSDGGIAQTAFGELPNRTATSGTAEAAVKCTEFSILGEPQPDLIDPDQPLVTVKTVKNQENFYTLLTAAIGEDTVRLETYRSAAECILYLPDLFEQPPILLPTTAETDEGSQSLSEWFDGLAGEATAEGDYLLLEEDGDTVTYTLGLKREDETSDTSDTSETANTVFAQAGDLSFVLKTVQDRPTELDLTANVGDADEAVKLACGAKWEGEDKITSHGELTSDGQTLSFDGAVTATDGALTCESTVRFADSFTGESKLTLSKADEQTLSLDGSMTFTARTEDGSSFSIPLTANGSFTVQEDGASTGELDLRASGSELFAVGFQCTYAFTPGETSVTMPENAIPLEDVDLDELTEALLTAYPSLGMFDDGNFDLPDASYYASADDTLYATVYSDGSVQLSATSVEVRDDGETLSFFYNGAPAGEDAYTTNADGSIDCFGLHLEELEEPELYQCERILFYENGTDFSWVEIDFYDETDVSVDLYLPARTDANGNASALLLPSGQPLPFALSFPEDGVMQIGETTLNEITTVPDSGATDV